MPVVGLSAERTAGSEKTAEVLRLSGYLTEKFLSDEVISPDEAAIVEYGLESIGSNLPGFAVTLLLGRVFGLFAESFILWLLVFPLRKNAGGKITENWSHIAGSNITKGNKFSGMAWKL